MFDRSVSFVAKINGNGLKCPSFAFNPNEFGVRVELEGENGDQIRITVHLESLATEVDGRALAREVVARAMNRIAYHSQAAIDDARFTGEQFSPVNQPPGVHEIAVNMALHLSDEVHVSDEVHAVVGVSPAKLKAALEVTSPAGERYFGLFRSARRSTGPVEEFMHRYHILLMLNNDHQVKVDAFVVGEEPTVPRTRSPRKPGAMETIYTRLRNEFAHQRVEASLEDTKLEMANRVGRLRGLTKRAIELHP